MTVFDLHSRRSDPARASRDVRSVLQSSDGSEIVKKIDSLLRGNIAAEVGELSRDGSPVIVAAGLPRQGRTVQDGVVLVDGVALHSTDLCARSRSRLLGRLQRRSARRQSLLAYRWTTFAPGG